MRRRHRDSPRRRQACVPAFLIRPAHLPVTPHLDDLAGGRTHTDARGRSSGEVVKGDGVFLDDTQMLVLARPSIDVRGRGGRERAQAPGVAVVGRLGRAASRVEFAAGGRAGLGGGAAGGEGGDGEVEFAEGGLQGRQAGDDDAQPELHGGEDVGLGGEVGVVGAGGVHGYDCAGDVDAVGTRGGG